MATRKSFNFRQGLQVDNDNFVVNPSGLVGIGTTNPQEFLDVYGNATGALQVHGKTNLVGRTEATDFYSGIATVGLLTATDADVDDLLTVGRIQVGFGATVDNLIGYAFTTWNYNESSGGIYTTVSVGIGTTHLDNWIFQVEGDPLVDGEIGVGITGGDVYATGIVSATGFTAGESNFVGNLSGIATSAYKLETARNVTLSGVVQTNELDVPTFDGTGNLSIPVTFPLDLEISTSGEITANSFNGTLNSGTANINSGIITSATIKRSATGIGTFDQLFVDKKDIDDVSEASLLTVRSDVSSSVSLGQSVGTGNSSAHLIYTPGAGSLEIQNYDGGGVVVDLHTGIGTLPGAGIGTQPFKVKGKVKTSLTATHDGKVGVNLDDDLPTNTLEVKGNTAIKTAGAENPGNLVIDGTITIKNGDVSNELTLGDGSPLPIPDGQNINTTTGISTFNDLEIRDKIIVKGTNDYSITALGESFFNSRVGIGTTNAVGFIPSDDTNGHTNAQLQIFGLSYAEEGFVCGGASTTKTAKLGISTRPNGKFWNDATDAHGRGSMGSQPGFNPGDLFPHFDYGNFQVDTGNVSFITGNIAIVNGYGTSVPASAPDNGGVLRSGNYGLLPYNQLDGGNKYLTSIGINTFNARGIVDIGAASTTMNSYVVLPSLSQDDLDIVSNLWDRDATGNVTINDDNEEEYRLGHPNARQSTPYGVPPGSVVYNSTIGRVQVRDTANSFRDLEYSATLSTPQSTTNQTVREFTDVPSWAKRITVMFRRVSVDGNNPLKVQLGTSSSYFTTNSYSSQSVNAPGNDVDTATDGFVIMNTNANDLITGQMIITKFSNTAWVATGQFSMNATAGYGNQCFGDLSYTDPTTVISKIKILTDANTFDLGEINVMYEG